MFITIVLGVIVGGIVLFALAALSQENPGCAGILVLGILLFALGRCIM